MILLAQFLLFAYFGSTWVWTQGLMPPRQVLYYLSHVYTPFLL
jgi:hypothetical protein